MSTNKAYAICILYWEMDRDPPLDAATVLMEAGWDIDALEQQHRY